MPHVYHVFEVRRFPSRKKFGTTDQLQLLNDVDQNMETCTTVIQLAAKNIVPGVARYDAEHEFLVRLQFLGRARGVRFQEFVSPYQFPVYLEERSGSTPNSVLVRTKAKVAHDFVRRLNKGVPDFAATDRMVDFDKLRPLLGTVSGAWFRDIQAAYLSAAGVFGPHVDKSEEFQHAEQIGKLRALTVAYPHGENTYSLMLTETGSIVVFNAIEAEAHELELVFNVKRSVLDKSWLA